LIYLDKISRREFLPITLPGGAAAAWPLAATAQQKSVPLIGWLHGGFPFPPQVNTFRSLLKAQGLVEGDNFAIEYRWGNMQISRMPDLAADLVRQRPAVIVA
jgi:putative ABC transport system substrate-binding protein